MVLTLGNDASRVVFDVQCLISLLVDILRHGYPDIEHPRYRLSASLHPSPCGVISTGVASTMQLSSSGLSGAQLSASTLKKTYVADLASDFYLCSVRTPARVNPLNVYVRFAFSIFHRFRRRLSSSILRAHGSFAMISQADMSRVNIEERSCKHRRADHGSHSNDDGENLSTSITENGNPGNFMELQKDDSTESLGSNQSEAPCNVYSWTDRDVGATEASRTPLAFTTNY